MIRGQDKNNIMQAQASEPGAHPHAVPSQGISTTQSTLEKGKDGVQPPPYESQPQMVMQQQPQMVMQQQPQIAMQQQPQMVMQQQPQMMMQQQPQMYQPQPQTIQQASQQQVFVSVTNNNQPKHSGMRQAIPELPMGLAIILCIVNFLLPGIGTIWAGFCVLCCGNVGQSDMDRLGTFCTNFWVGWLQLILALFIVGWVWSIMWGIAFVAIAGAAGEQQQTTTTAMIASSTVAEQAVPH